MRAEGRRLEALVARPWLVAAAAALLIAVPLVVLGQVSDSDTRSRAQAAQLDSTAYTADAIARTYLDHIQLIQTALASLALSPRPDTSPLGLALARDDLGSLQAVADQLRNEFPRYVLRSYVALRGNAETITDPTIAAVSPADHSLAGRHLSALDQPLAGAFTSLVGVSANALAETGLFTAFYATGAAPPARLLAAVAVPGTISPACGNVCRVTRSPALLLVELDNARMFTDAASPSIGPDDDAYLINAKHQLIARVRERAPDPRLDLTSDPIIGRIGDGSQIATAGTDPLGHDPRVIATRHLPNGSTALNVVVSHDASVAEREVDDTLGQLALLRLLIVFALVALAGVAALTASRVATGAVYRERLRLARELHDLLGHSLSVVALKTQLARRLLASDDDLGAAAEISDTERVARDSLRDVRGAIDGYRQPS